MTYASPNGATPLRARDLRSTFFFYRKKKVAKPLRAKSRLRRLRSETRLRAQKCALRKDAKDVSPSAEGDQGAALDLPPFEKGGPKL